MLARMVRHVDVVIDQKCSSRLRFSFLNCWNATSLDKVSVLSVRFEVGVSLLLAPARADKRGPKASFPLVENAGIQPAICKRVPAGAPAGAGSYWKHCSKYVSNCRKSRDYQRTNRVFVRTMEFETRKTVCYAIRQKRLPFGKGRKDICMFIHNSNSNEMKWTLKGHKRGYPFRVWKFKVFIEIL